MAIDRYPTTMIDQLEEGPWPSFISGIKRLRDEHPEARINEMTNSCSGQLEHSYETRKGYWKGGTVSVYGYGGGIIPRFSEVGKAFPESKEFHTLRVQPPAGNHTAPGCCAARRQLGEVGFGPGDLPRPDRQHHVHRYHHREHPALLRRDQRVWLGPRRRRSLRSHRDVLRRRCTLRDVLHQRAEGAPSAGEQLHR